MPNTNTPATQPMDPADFSRGITLNIRQTAQRGTIPIFRAVIFHDTQKISEIRGTRNEVAKHIASVVAERLFTGPGGPLGGIEGILGRLLGGRG